jgi:hypothetical protein
VSSALSITILFLLAQATLPLTQSNRMQVTYDLTQRDFYDSFIAHRNRTVISKWSFRLLACFLVPLIGWQLFALVEQPTRQTLSSLTPLFGLSVLWVWVIWVIPWRAARSQFLKQPAAQGPRTILLDATGIHMRWTGGSSDREWKNFIRWVEGRGQVLLYSSPASFSMIPERSLDDTQLSELRAILAQNIAPSGKRRT